MVPELETDACDAVRLTTWSGVLALLLHTSPVISLTHSPSHPPTHPPSLPPSLRRFKAHDEQWSHSSKELQARLAETSQQLADLQSTRDALQSQVADLSSSNLTLQQQLSQQQAQTVDHHVQEKVALAKARGEIVALETRLRSMEEVEGNMAALLREKAELQAHVQRLDRQLRELCEQLVSGTDQQVLHCIANTVQESVREDQVTEGNTALVNAATAKEHYETKVVVQHYHVFLCCP